MDIREFMGGSGAGPQPGPAPPNPPVPKRDSIRFTRTEYYKTTTGAYYIVVEVAGFAGFRGKVRYHYHDGTRWVMFGTDSVEGDFGDPVVGAHVSFNSIEAAGIGDVVHLYAELLDPYEHRVAETQAREGLRE